MFNYTCRKQSISITSTWTIFQKLNHRLIKDQNIVGDLYVTRSYEAIPLAIPTLNKIKISLIIHEENSKEMNV
jgi:hypothetical protein